MKAIVNDGHLSVRQGSLNSLEEQLLLNDPPEIKETYDRLLSQGFTDLDARRMLSIVIASDTLTILKNKEPFDRARFVATLRNLPRFQM